MGKNSECTIHKENQCAKDKIHQNITVVLHVYNEEGSIGSTILLARLYADNVIVVDGGSLDHTGEIAKKAGAKVIVHKIKKGKSAALETGFKVAAELGATVIVTMDSKGHHNPAEIPRLVAPIVEGHADIVNGSRYLNNLGKNNPFYRRVGQFLLSSATKISSDSNITDSQSGFRAFAASTKDIFHFNAQDTILESKMLADAGKSSLRIKEVEVGVLHDFKDPVRNPVKSFLIAFKNIGKNIEANRSLYLNSIPGFILAICGLCVGFHLFMNTFLGIGSLHFWPAFVMVFLSVGGAYITMRGIVMHSLVEVIKQIEAVDN